MNYVFHFGELSRFVPLLLEGALNTLLFSGVGMLAGTTIGLLGAVWRSARNPGLRLIAATYVELIRNTPLLVQLFVLFFALPSLGVRLTVTQAALLGLVLNNGAYMAEIIRAGIENIHASQREAAASLGLTRVQTFWWVVIPQAFDRIYPAMVSQFTLLMLSSSIISAIGADELTAYGARIQSETFRSIETYLAVAGLYLALTYVLRGAAVAAARWVFPRRRALRQF